MPNNFEQSMKEFEDNQEGSDIYFKFPVGKTKMRVLSDFTASHSLFEGEYPNGKFVKKLDKYEKPEEGFTVKTSWNAWALIDNELKVIQFPYSLMKQFKALTDDPEWGFKGFPMGHDITVSNTGEGGARYSLIGSPVKSEVPEKILTELNKRITKKAPNNLKAAVSPEDYPINTDEISF